MIQFIPFPPVEWLNFIKTGDSQEKMIFHLTIMRRLTQYLLSPDLTFLLTENDVTHSGLKQFWKFSAREQVGTYTLTITEELLDRL